MNLGQYLVQQLLEDNIQEVYPKRSSDDINQNYVTKKEHWIEKAAADFNYPIPDIRFAFIAGGMVVLTDEIWSKLENQDLEDDLAFDGPAMILNYDDDKYYLVYGGNLLRKHKELNKIPKVLMGKLNVKGPKPFSLKEGLDRNILNEFLKFVVKELDLKQLPSKVTLSKNVKKARTKHTFGTFAPDSNAIWLYVNNRNTADILRTLAHELVHRKQEEDGRLEPNSGETGSEIENEANAQAGVLLRKFGEKNPMIYEGLIKELGGIENIFSWNYDFVDDDGNYFYSFNTPKNKYSVGISPEGSNSYVITFNTEGEMGQDTGEGVAMKVIATVTAITLNFINKENPDELIFRPIKTKGEDDMRRFNVYGYYLEKNLPSNYNLITLGNSYRIIKK